MSRDLDRDTAVAWRGGGRTGRRSRASEFGRHPKGEIAKIKMLQLDNFPYWKATNTGCMDLIFRNLFFCQHYFLRIQMPVILTFFNTRDLYSRCVAHTQSNCWWCEFFQIVRSRENHKKGLCTFDFLSQISKLSYFNLLDLAYFLMHHYNFPFRFLMWQPWVCADTAAHLCLQYAHHFELSH